MVNFSNNIKENLNFQEKNFLKEITKKSLNHNNDDNNKKETNISKILYFFNSRPDKKLNQNKERFIKWKGTKNILILRNII